jgi:lysophospholipase L1-like esterase
MRGFAVFVLVFLVITNCNSQEWDTIPVMPDHYEAKLEAFEKEKVTYGKILFLGNSITENGDFKKLLNDSTVLNRGIGGDITFGIIRRLNEVTRHKPSKLFLLIGINDLYKGIPEQVILQNIFLIISTIHIQSPKTQVVVQSILPVNKSFLNFPKGYDLTENVIVVNRELSRLTKRLNYTFVDMYREFTDKEGNLKAGYSKDGLHLNGSGYNQWIKILKDAKHL